MRDILLRKTSENFTHEKALFTQENDTMSREKSNKKS